MLSNDLFPLPSGRSKAHGRGANQGSQIPKLNTKSGAKKRFKVTASGKVKCQASRKRHGMIQRPTKFIRTARGTMVLSDEDAKIVKKTSSLFPLGLRRDLTRRSTYMSRVKRGVTSHARHRKVIKAARVTTAAARIPSASPRGGREGRPYAYRDRKVKKRTFRALWIQRINAAARENGLTYGRLDRRAEEGRDRARPKGACRYRRARARKPSRAWSRLPPLPRRPRVPRHAGLGPGPGSLSP